MASYEFVSHGKWILTGEHAVLRNKPALVFPLKALGIRCKYEAGGDELEVQFGGERASELKIILWGALEAALQNLGRRRSELKGQLNLMSDLPVGTGLGASAALGVLISRWFVFLGWIGEPEVYELARGIENIFHGESSGVDIAASMSDGGLRFLRDGSRDSIEVNWSPQWYLSYSGDRGMTSECVKKVQAMSLNDPETFSNIDEHMHQATDLAEEALRETEETGFEKLKQSIDMANECFNQWALNEGAMGRHLTELRNQGAAAVKPTGSGDGGYVLSLWTSIPPEPLANQLLKL